jgi:hypothetical protein
MAAEQDVVAIAAKFNAGSLALDAQPLKHSLRSEAASWKAQFARNLHKQGVQNLKVITLPLLYFLAAPRVRPCDALGVSAPSICWVRSQGPLRHSLS